MFIIAVKNIYIFYYINTFFYYFIFYICFSVNFKNILICLEKIFNVFIKFLIIYSDRNKYFNNKKVKFFLLNENVRFILDFSKLFKFFEIIKYNNELLENIIKKLFYK